jgi:hypothetical protein
MLVGKGIPLCYRGKANIRREGFVDRWIYEGGNWVCVGTDATPVLH